MQQPKMIVMGLIAQGFRYGLEMERFIDLSKMRLWARIGKSTIYKALRELEKSGDVTAKMESAARGPGKAVFDLTSKGESQLHDLVGEALASRESVYSDRIAGLVFSRSLPKTTAMTMLDQSITGLSKALDAIDAEARAMDSKPVAKIVINFYRTVYEAEQLAMNQMKQVLNSHSDSKAH